MINCTGGSGVKNLPMQEIRFDPCVGKIPWRRKWQPTPALLPGKSHGQRSLAGCSPWGHRGVGHALATKQQQYSSFRDSPEKEMATYSSILAWEIPWTEEPGRLRSMRLLRVGYDWATSLWLLTFMHWRRKWQPTPVFLPGESQGQRSLAGYSPRNHKESNMTDLVHVCVELTVPWE